MKKLLFTTMIISLLFSSLVFARIPKEDFKPRFDKHFATNSDIKRPKQFNKDWKKDNITNLPKDFDKEFKHKKGTPSQIRPKNDKRNNKDKKEFPTFKDKPEFKPSN